MSPTRPEQPVHPPYSGPEVTCTKCGHGGAFTTYRGYGQCLHGDLAESIGYEPNPRLHRECERCSFSWDEATVEPEPSTVEITIQPDTTAMQEAIRQARRESGLGRRR
ncbi:hypothetical protein [Streptomyces altiplanensis]